MYTYTYIYIYIYIYISVWATGNIRCAELRPLDRHPAPKKNVRKLVEKQKNEKGIDAKQT